MNRRMVLTLGAAGFLSACVSQTSSVRVGPDGLPLPQVYKITPGTEGEVQYRLLDSVNSLRASSGAQPLQFNAALNAAAATHARDMSVQNRPWHFGSDGSSPLSRVQRVGYQGSLVGELISETFETELITLGAWMKQADTRNIIMDNSAREIGFSWYQEPSGKIWWCLITGG